MSIRPSAYFLTVSHSTSTSPSSAAEENMHRLCCPHCRYRPVPRPCAVRCCRHSGEPVRPVSSEGRRVADVMLVTVDVDTHTDVHVAAVLDPAGRLLETRSFPAATRDYAQLATWAESFGTVDKVGMEGTGSFGAGLLRFLADYGLTVIDVNRPDRAVRRRRPVPAGHRGAEVPRRAGRDDPGTARRPPRCDEGPYPGRSPARRTDRDRTRARPRSAAEARLQAADPRLRSTQARSGQRPGFGGQQLPASHGWGRPASHRTLEIRAPRQGDGSTGSSARGDAAAAGMTGRPD